MKAEIWRVLARSQAQEDEIPAPARERGEVKVEGAQGYKMLSRAWIYAVPVIVLLLLFFQGRKKYA
jgi:hypothetical protein